MKLRKGTKKKRKEKPKKKKKNTQKYLSET
jgi:hypothetical protein